MSFTQFQYWLFDGIQGAVRLPDHTALLETASAFFALWPHTVTDEDPSAGTLLTVRYRTSRFTLSAPWLSRPLYEPTTTCLLCSLGIEMIRAFRQAQPHVLCLHAAAAAFTHGTVLLLGDNRAGKSSLAVRLMANCHTIYADDLIGITSDGQAFAFGIAPRLRLPLPPSSRLAEFVQRHAGPGDARYQYVTADPLTMASHGATTPISHAIVLQRHSSGHARLASLPAETGLSQLAGRYIMQQGDASFVARQASRLADRISFLCLHYADLDDAVACLEQHLDTQAAPCLPAGSVTQPFDTPSYSKMCPAAILSDNLLYQQSQGVSLLRKGHNAFLCTPDNNTLYGLNASGLMLWQLLQAPVSISDAVQLLQKAYPHIPAVRLHRDISQLFAHLKNANLIESCSKD